MSFETLEARTLLTTFGVNTPLDSVDVNPGDGIAVDAQGFTSLRAAVMEANALAGDDVILLDPGVRTLSLSGPDSDATHDIDVRSNILIRTTGSAPTSIVGSAGDRIFHVHLGASLTLSGVVIQGGDTAGLGGGIFNEGGILKLVNTTVTENSASNGGAIANTGDLLILNSTISGNTGGGIYNSADGTLAIRLSTISNNVAATAAGIDNLGAADLISVIVAGNVGTTTNTDVAGAFASGGHNLIGNVGDGSGATGFTSDDFVGTGTSPIDPKLAGLAINGGSTSTHALLPGSPAIDGGKSNVADSSGQNNSASIIGAVVAVAGKSGLGARFPGGVGDVADDYIAIDVDNLVASDVPTTAITVAAWVNITHTGFTHAIFASRTGSGEFITHAEVLDDGQARFTLRDDGGNTIIDLIGGSVPFGQWFHYAATYDKATNQVAVYVNGIAIFNGPATNNAAIGANWDGGARIGATTANARPFTGRMDEFYLFTRALASSEIATLAAVPPSPAGAPQVTGNLSIYYSFEDIATTLDQHGGPRILDGDGLNGATIDIGAFERVNDFNPDNPIPEEIQTGDITVRVSLIGVRLVSPSEAINAGDGSGRLFINDQIGYIRLIKNGVLRSVPFLDITSLVPSTLNGNDERGISGFEFHPDFAVPGAAGYGKFYTWVDELVDVTNTVDFTHYPLDPGVQRAAQSVLREWTMANITDDVFAGTSREIVRIDIPHQAHSAGHAEFGPDGYLYLSIGDGGTHDDQGRGHIPIIGNAQSLTDIYGSILRIDPMGNNSANGKYGIPATNPFVGVEDALDEIYFYGLRNPFRFSFELDALGNKTTKIVIADTGQDHIEEVDRADIIADVGGNFGWNRKEGSFLFDPGPPPSPSGELRIGATAYSPGFPFGMIDPVVEYDHGPNGEGSAVIGGYVYQGDLIPELKGKYIFGDFNTFSGPTGRNGRIFYTDFSAQNPEIFELNLEGTFLSGAGGLDMFIKGFGIDEAGELYVVGSVTLSSADRSGVILKLMPLPKIGDYDDNGTVGEADYGVWRTNFGRTGVSLAADGNGNGAIDAADYVVWRKMLDPALGASAGPEGDGNGLADAGDDSVNGENFGEKSALGAPGATASWVLPESSSPNGAGPAYVDDIGRAKEVNSLWPFAMTVETRASEFSGRFKRQPESQTWAPEVWDRALLTLLDMYRSSGIRRWIPIGFDAPLYGAVQKSTQDNSGSRELLVETAFADSVEEDFEPALAICEASTETRDHTAADRRFSLW